MPSERTRTILVGLDGSDLAKVTLAVAARRAGDEDHLVAAHVVAVEPALLKSPYFDEALERARARETHVLDEARSSVGVERPLTLKLLEGPPARTLVDLAHDLGAVEIVIGSRGFGSLRAAALGSTAHALLHESDMPVVVVPRKAVERERHLSEAGSEASAPVIVVGYDGSDNGREALEFALERHAAVRGSVVAVYAFAPPADLLGWPYYQRALEDHQRRGRDVLRELEQRPEVEADLVVGPPAEALTRVAAARDASEIVVGARGLGRFRAALGSVSLALMHDADRPVVVVPPKTTY